MLIVLIATEWGTREGGVNSFNYSFASGLANVCGDDNKIICAVTSIGRDDRNDASRHGIDLVEVSSDEKGRPSSNCAAEIQNWLHDNMLAVPSDIVVVGHDCITGFQAAETAERLGGRLALIHHMSYQRYQNLAGGKGEKTGHNHQQQIDLFSRPDALLFGVGTFLTRNAEILSGSEAHCLVPGFPEGFTKNSSDVDDLNIVVAGRFDEEQEALKQVELAVEAVGLAVKTASRFIRPLRSATMFVLGVDERRVSRASLEKLAKRKAGRNVTVIPMLFDSRPETIRKLLRSANLTIMPSFHEGFGLVGWEAIGSEVPLIIGKETGLFKFVESVLGTTGIHAVEFNGGASRSRDVQLVSDAIIEIAKDLQLARKDARDLRKRLKSERGCTWKQTAHDFLHSVSASVPNTERSRLLQNPIRRQKAAIEFESTKKDHFERCVELSLSVGQGSTAESFDVLAQLWFGATPIQLGSISAEISLNKAYVDVIPTAGIISGPRLGDTPRVKGLKPVAGGVWVVTDPNGRDVLEHRALGDEALCQVVTPPNSLPEVTVRVLASRKDLNCKFDTPEQEGSVAKEKVMSVFLQKAIFDDNSGQITFSEATMTGVGSDD
ncbi:glycosyltransferase family 4 protein [Rhizobium leguminosarum]|uniref:Glycosyltransferase n=1 Tax=Rhizobium leguminosarum TaxID=384 RepID=A0A2K9Z6T9_RHILE|nr:glycosyltransferase family 4 protein [Rhizobium leguminosarum]AUW43952.1 hypothetical protein CUJ84_Chr003621 [Rhizobium leguminosarum]